MTFPFWLFSHLPLSALQALSGRLGVLTAKVSGRYHDRLIANFCHIYPNVTPTMLKEAGQSTGRMVFEMPYFQVHKNGADVAPHLFDMYRTVAERAFADGRGLIFLTPHLGRLEVLPQTYTRGHPVTSLLKPSRKASLHGWIETMQVGSNMQITPANPHGVRMLVRALKRGETVSTLPDQTPTAGEGVWTPFFGKPTYTMTLVHRLHQLAGVSIVALFVERLPCGTSYRLHSEEIDDLPEGAMQVATRISAAVERLIVMAPTQYLWDYNHYKHPKDADVPPTA